MNKSAIALLVPLACFLAIGCSVFEPRWERVAPPLEPVWVQASVEELRAICEDESAAFRSFACIRRRLERGMCLVFSVRPRGETLQFVIEHEEQRHCREGLNHD